MFGLLRTYSYYGNIHATAYVWKCDGSRSKATSVEKHPDKIVWIRRKKLLFSREMLYNVSKRVTRQIITRLPG